MVPPSTSRPTMTVFLSASTRRGGEGGAGASRGARRAPGPPGSSRRRRPACREDEVGLLLSRRPWRGRGRRGRRRGLVVVSKSSAVGAHAEAWRGGWSRLLGAERHHDVVPAMRALPFSVRRRAVSTWAQGGISAVLDPADTFDAHVQDTLVAGAGLCKPDIVRAVRRDAPERIRDLIELGTRFSRGRRPGRRLRPHARGRAQRAAGHPRGRHHRAARSSARCSRPSRRTRASRCSSTTWGSTSSALKFGGPEVCAGAYVLDDPRGEVHTCSRGHGAGHRGRGQGLPLHVQPRRRDGRRRGHGVPRGRRGGEHGVLPVPPHGAVPPAGQELPHQRGPARRGRHRAAARRRHGLHEEAPPHRRTSRRATWWPAPSTSR
jgi:hypothetical protein